MANAGRTFKHYIELALERNGSRLSPDERMELIAAADELDRMADEIRAINRVLADQVAINA